MLKKINRSLYILNDKKEKIIVELDNNGMIVGDYKIRGNAEYLCGNASKIEGDVSNIWGRISQEGIDIYGLPIPSLQGDMSKIKGNITGVYGNASYLIGDVSKIKGDATGVYGDVDKAIAEYLQKNNLTELEDKIDINLLID